MAANPRDIRRRIKSVKNTKQITKAMQMVAASKMRRAQAAALAGRPYADLMNKVLAALSGQEESVPHPLLEERPVKREAVLVISTDKGLCGALNTNLFREVSQFDAAKTVFVTAGRRGAQFLARTKREILADFQLRDAPRSIDAKVVSRFLIEKFLAGEVDRVTVLYSDFVNTLTQRPTTRTVLPCNAADLVASTAPGKAPAAPAANTTEYLYEPSAQEVLDAVLPHYVHFQIYQMILDARAAEHSARMVAMKNATENADSLIKDLTLEYNKVRQAAITNEILEISTAQMALG
jgi:F-type H+-transporting ATPase subunit gamma